MQWQKDIQTHIAPCSYPHSVLHPPQLAPCGQSKNEQKWESPTITNTLMRGVFLLAFAVSCLLCLSVCAEPMTDEQWLKSEEDVQTLAEVSFPVWTQCVGCAQRAEAHFVDPSLRWYCPCRCYGTQENCSPSWSRSWLDCWVQSLSLSAVAYS